VSDNVGKRFKTGDDDDDDDDVKAKNYCIHVLLHLYVFMAWAGTNLPLTVSREKMFLQ
jgi:hypothetical protein